LCCLPSPPGKGAGPQFSRTLRGRYSRVPSRPMGACDRFSGGAGDGSGDIRTVPWALQAPPARPKRHRISNRGSPEWLMKR
jgi:hypothetical protein